MLRIITFIIIEYMGFWGFWKLAYMPNKFIKNLLQRVGKFLYWAFQKLISRYEKLGWTYFLNLDCQPKPLLR